MPKAGETVRRAVTLPLYQRIWIQEYVGRYNTYSNVSDFVLSSVRHTYLELMDFPRSYDNYRNFIKDFVSLDKPQDDYLGSLNCTVHVTWPKGLLTDIEQACSTLASFPEFETAGKKDRDLFRSFVVAAVQQDIDHICRYGVIDENLVSLGFERQISLEWLESAGILGTDEVDNLLKLILK